MNILEEAEMLNEIAEHIAAKKRITVQETWNEANEELKIINRSKELQYEWNMEKKLSRSQKEFLASLGLNPDNYLVERKLQNEIGFINKETNKVEYFKLDGSRC